MALLSWLPVKGLNLKPIESDCAPLNDLVGRLIKAAVEIHCMRDLTRGGLASALNEISQRRIIPLPLTKLLSLYAKMWLRPVPCWDLILCMWPMKAVSLSLFPEGFGQSIGNSQKIFFRPAGCLYRQGFRREEAGRHS